jgi:hypothetical protein
MRPKVNEQEEEEEEEEGDCPSTGVVGLQRPK